MAESQELQEFNSLIGRRIKEQIPMQTFWAICKSVDWEAKTMVATGQIDELDYEDVSLGLGSEYKKPKAGTICLLGIEQNEAANTYLIDASEFEEIINTVGTTVMTTTPNGVRIERNGQNVFTCLSDMIDELNKIIVINGTTINVPAMQLIKQRLNTVLIE